MEKDQLHEKIIATAKRLRDDDVFDVEDAFRYAIKTEGTSWMEKNEEFDPPAYFLREDDE